MSEVSLIAQRSEVCTHCHDRGQTNTQAATPSGSSKHVGTRSPETTTNLSKDDPFLCPLLLQPSVLSVLPGMSRRNRLLTESLLIPVEWSHPWLSAKRSGGGFLLNGLPDGQRLISAGGFPSEYISFGQGQNDKI